ncbi:hypothetical protein [Holzapfeliella sp. JNUCC 80]
MKGLIVVLGACLALFAICINQYNQEVQNVYAMNQKKKKKKKPQPEFEDELTRINKIPDKSKRNQEKKRLRLEKQELLNKVQKDSQTTVISDEKTVQSKASITFVYTDEDIKEEV